MSKERIEPELSDSRKSGSESKVESKSQHWTEEVVLSVAKVVKYENKYKVNLGLSELNQIAINDGAALSKLEDDIRLLNERAEQTAIADCKDRQDQEFDLCVENKKAIHLKHMGLDELTRHLEQQEKELSEKLNNKLRELRNE